MTFFFFFLKNRTCDFLSGSCTIIKYLGPYFFGIIHWNQRVGSLTWTNFLILIEKQIFSTIQKFFIGFGVDNVFPCSWTNKTEIKQNHLLQFYFMHHLLYLLNNYKGHLRNQKTKIKESKKIIRGIWYRESTSPFDIQIPENVMPENLNLRNVIILTFDLPQKYNILISGLFLGIL